MLPVMHLDGRGTAFPGAVSDASLLDVITVCADPDIWLDGATPNSIKALRAGTVALMTSADRAATPRSKDEHGAEARFMRYVAIAASQYNANRFGIYETEEASLDGETYQPMPANAISTGRIWLITKSNTGIVANAAVAVATSGSSDPVVGWVQKAAAAADAIPGWFFTGRVDTFKAGAITLDLAEVQVRPQTVAAPVVVAVSGVSITEPNQTLAAGATFTFHAVVAPANASNKVVKWSSSATGVATVDQDTGLVTVAAGATTGQTATITATTEDGAKTATRTVTVQ